MTNRYEWAYLLVMRLACVYGHICQVNSRSHALVYTLSGKAVAASVKDMTKTPSSSIARATVRLHKTACVTTQRVGRGLERQLLRWEDKQTQQRRPPVSLYSCTPCGSDRTVWRSAGANTLFGACIVLSTMFISRSYKSS
jgi:hypothetical protein